jgi:hypothetical protein
MLMAQSAEAPDLLCSLRYVLSVSTIDPRKLDTSRVVVQTGKISVAAKLAERR